jgi:DNA-binding NarL/FixJ family response regulator
MCDQSTGRRLACLIVFPCPVVRVGVRAALGATNDLVASAEAGTIAEALGMASVARPDVVLLAAPLLPSHGDRAPRRVAEIWPGSTAIVLSTVDWDVYLARAWTAGAAGFLLTQHPLLTLVAGIRRAAAGKPIFSAEQLRRLQVWEQTMGSCLNALSPREAMVFRLVLAGKQTREIAEVLAISRHTAEKHLGAILSKFGVDSRADLLALAFHHHLEA